MRVGSSARPRFSSDRGRKPSKLKTNFTSDAIRRQQKFLPNI